MARMRSKRHAPLREDFMLKEQSKTEQGIFDSKTMKNLSKLFSKGIISKLDYLIAKGKEADLYIGRPGNSDIVAGQELVALKFFRVNATAFSNINSYIIGDPRFERQVGKGRYGIITTWCRKEFGNLSIAREAGVLAPQPYAYSGNVLAMQFIGDKGVIAPTLRDATLDEPETILKRILEDMERLFSYGIVHADLSEYNILVYENSPYMIDFGQAVSVKHPRAPDFLKKDLSNMLKFFRKHYRIDYDYEKSYRSLTSSSI